jgi:hypothetical protein
MRRAERLVVDAGHVDGWMARPGGKTRLDEVLGALILASITLSFGSRFSKVSSAQPNNYFGARNHQSVGQSVSLFDGRKAALLKYPHPVLAMQSPLGRNHEKKQSDEQDRRWCQVLVREFGSTGGVTGGRADGAIPRPKRPSPITQSRHPGRSTFLLQLLAFGWAPM